jgi:hypothetical protein
MNSQVMCLLLVFLLAITITSSSKNDSSLIANEHYAALEYYKAVLQNKAKFISTDEENEVYLDDFLTNGMIFDTTFIINRFTVVDLDHDEVPEVLIELQAPDSYEILRYNNGSVYGYIQGHRSFSHIKMDGTFSFSGGASYYGYGKLIFESNVCETILLGYYESDYEGTEINMINNKPVTEKLYSSFSTQQDQKEDVIWYEFSQENIEQLLSI